MEYSSAHGCRNGWLGYDDDHKPIPCLVCRPNLSKTAHVNDCGKTDEPPRRRHPVEDAWTEVVQAEFVEDHQGLNFRELPTPASLDEFGDLVIETASLSWASALRSRAQPLIHRVNAKLGDAAVASITVTIPAPEGPATVSR